MEVSKLRSNSSPDTLPMLVSNCLFACGWLRWKVVLCISIWTTIEKNYGISELKTLGPVWAVRYFPSYILGYPCTVYPDHATCSSLLGSQRLSGKLSNIFPLLWSHFKSCNLWCYWRMQGNVWHPWHHLWNMQIDHIFSEEWGAVSYQKRACSRLSYEAMVEFKGGVRLDSCLIQILLFVDDTVVMTQTEKDLTENIGRLYEVMNRHGLAINWSKSNTIVFSK